jgi:hypothetical protein
MTRFLTLFLTCLALAGCAQTGPDKPVAESPALERDPSPADYIKPSKTACFGFCPVFDLTLYGDGRVLFHGGRYTKQSGQHTTRYSTGRFLEVLRALEARGFRDLDARYDRQTCKIWATDHPSVIMEVRAEGLAKSVTWYQGCRGIDDRARLSRMVEELDRILQVETFVGTEAEREQIVKKRSR